MSEITDYLIECLECDLYIDDNAKEYIEQHFSDESGTLCFDKIAQWVEDHFDTCEPGFNQLSDTLQKAILSDVDYDEILKYLENEYETHRINEDHK